MNKKIIISWALLLIVFAVNVNAEDTIVHIKDVGAVNGTDTYLAEELADEPQTTYGAYIMGTQGAGNDRGRDLLNLSFVKKSVPIGATINWFIIEFYNEGDYVENCEDTTIYPVKTPWVETVTWNGFNTGGVNMTDFNGTYSLITQYSPVVPPDDTYFNVTIDNAYAQKFFDGTLGVWDEGLILMHNPGEANPGVNTMSFWSSTDNAVEAERLDIYILIIQLPHQTQHRQK